MMNKKEQKYNRRLAFKANSTVKAKRDKKKILVGNTLKWTGKSDFN